jgi:hypothetical protein
MAVVFVKQVDFIAKGFLKLIYKLASEPTANGSHLQL